MARNWSLPVGNSFLKATSASDSLAIGRTFTQPMQGRDDRRYCSGVEILFKSTATAAEKNLTAFMNGFLDVYPVAGGGSSIVHSFERTTVPGLSPDYVQGLIYDNVDSNSIKDSLRQVIAAAVGNAPDRDNILRTTSVREVNPTDSTKKLQLKDFASNSAKVESFLNDVVSGAQKVRVLAGNSIAQPGLVTAGDFPITTPGYSQAVRIMVEDGGGNYINPALVFLAMANYTINNKTKPINKVTHLSLSEIDLLANKNTYSHPFINLLQPTGKSAGYPEAQITLPNGHKPLDIAFLTNFHAPFANPKINVRWKYDRTSNLAVVTQNAGAIPTLSASQTTFIDDIWQSASARDTVNAVGKLFDVPVEIITAIALHESNHKIRPCRMEIARGDYHGVPAKQAIALMLKSKDRHWDTRAMGISIEEAIRIYDEMVKPMDGNIYPGHTLREVVIKGKAIKVGGYSWSVPDPIVESAVIDTHIPTSLTYKQYFGLLDCVPLNQSYYAYRVSPGITQTLITLVQEVFTKAQTHPRMQGATKKAQLANLGIYPLAPSARTGSGMLKWLLQKENSMIACCINLFVKRIGIYNISMQSGFPYFDPDHGLSHLDLPVVAAGYNQGTVMPAVTEYKQRSGPKAVWGMEIVGDNYYKDVIAAYNYIRSTPAIFNVIRCYLKNADF